MGQSEASGIRQPLHLTPRLVPKPWGGRRLERYGRTLPDGADIGESWEVADLDPSKAGIEDPSTRVATGPLEGRSLQELIAADGAALLGDAEDFDGRFPLLVKLLDAAEHLSIQVHPPAGFVSEHPDVQLKMESWVVLEADPGAQLFIGLAPGVTPSLLADTLGTPGMVPLLRHVTAVAGDVHHLPAGVVHCLGAGVVVAEVQTPSDTSFRVYDWADKYGRQRRRLHLEDAMTSILEAWDDNVTPTTSPEGAGQPVGYASVPDARLLVDIPHYRIVRCRLGSGQRSAVEEGMMRVIQVVEGALDGTGFVEPVARGGSVLLPAAWHGQLSASESTSWLETTVPTDGRQTRTEAVR